MKYIYTPNHTNYWRIIITEYLLRLLHCCPYFSPTAPSSPLNLSVSTVPGSPNQLSASWSPPIPKNGIIIAYTVYCNTSASQAYPEQVIGPNVPTVRSVVNGTTLAVILTTGLSPYTQYNCYVTANTSAGEGTPSQIVIAMTDLSSKQNSDIRMYKNAVCCDERPCLLVMWRDGQEDLGCLLSTLSIP